MSDLHHRSTLDDAFCEWLLSDHPEAKAEREWRRGTASAATAQAAAEIAGWADRVSAEPEQHTPMARDLAATIGPMAHASALRAEIEDAEPDDAYVARQRADFESHMRNHGSPTWATGTPPISPAPQRPATRRRPSRSRRRGHDAGRGDRGRRPRRDRDPVPAPARPRSLRAGHADGYRAGYRQADADQAARWNQAARAVDGPARAELEERRWGPGGRAHFADPRPGDFPGRGTQPRPEPETQPEIEAST